MRFQQFLIFLIATNEFAIAHRNEENGQRAVRGVPPPKPPPPPLPVPTSAPTVAYGIVNQLKLMDNEAGSVKPIWGADSASLHAGYAAQMASSDGIVAITDTTASEVAL